ncbi:MAG: hypothetical protein R2941_03275 [Desulfobacterales bacterium]
MKQLFLKIRIIVIKREIAFHSLICNECADGVLLCDEGWKLRMKHACLTKHLRQISESGTQKTLSWAE